MRIDKDERRNRSVARVRAALACIMLACVFGSLLCPAAFADGARKQPAVVRVGYFYNGDFMHKSADGSYAGYDVEYYYTLAGYAGWDIQFVEYDSLSQSLKALENGDIDVMSGLSKTDERLQKYLASSLKMCATHISVQTRASDDRFAAGNCSTMTDMSCGILRSSNVIALYKNWCAENGLTPHVVEYDSLELRNSALKNGEVDAVAAGSVIAGAQKIAEFPALDLYFMFNKNRPELKAQLDRAMNLLSIEDPTYATNLYKRYFPASRNTEPSFSADETAYLKQHPTIRVALLADDAPFSAQSGGGVEGILPAYYEHLSKVVGTSFQCVACASKEAACQALASGSVDMIGKFEENIFDANSRSVLLTVPYLRMNLVEIARAGTGTVNSAAVPECNEPAVAAAAGDELRLTTAVNSDGAFRALKKGAVDAVICTQPAATWLLNRNRASDYMVLAFGSDTWNVSCALPEGENGNTLRSILNKTVAVDNGYINQLITSDTLQDSADLSNVFDRLPVTQVATVAVIAVLLLAVAAAALVILVRRRRIELGLAERQARLTAEEETNRARRDFFGTVSHDMRTPLNGIVGFTDLALKSDDCGEVRDYLGKIRASSAILSNLVSDTLLMSRMENDKYTLCPTACGTAELFAGVLEPVRALAAEKGVTFQDNVAVQRQRVVLVDRLSFQKILLNLLTNAVKFTPADGTVTLACALEPPEGPQPETVITVSDTGVGISKEFLPLVFEPFTQEDAANGQALGSGMGLSIVRSIVEAMDGSIGVRSEKGRGTVFTVRLQLQELEAEKAGPQTERESAPEALRGRRALVCEDNEMNLEILRAVLEQGGMETESRENGLLGLEAFAESEPGTFDFVLLDLRMPVMDGLQTARAIRALERPDAKTVPIFAVSADAFPENVEECLEAGMNGHIAKPLDGRALLETLARSLKA